MLKLLADENFDNTIVRGLLRLRASLDLVRVQDVGLSGKDDPWFRHLNLTYKIGVLLRSAVGIALILFS